VYRCQLGLSGDDRSSISTCWVVTVYRYVVLLLQRILRLVQWPCDALVSTLTYVSCFPNTHLTPVFLSCCRNTHVSQSDHSVSDQDGVGCHDNAEQRWRHGVPRAEVLVLLPRLQSDRLLRGRHYDSGLAHHRALCRLRLDGDSQRPRTIDQRDVRRFTDCEPCRQNQVEMWETRLWTNAHWSHRGQYQLFIYCMTFPV